MQYFPDKEVKVVVEMLGVSKDKIKVNAYDNKAEVKSEDPQREYHRTIEIPLETAKSAYNNGILEIIFSKKEQVRRKAIKVEEPVTLFLQVDCHCLICYII